MKDKVNHFKDGYHLNSKYWQNYKKTLPVLSDELVEIAIGMILGDAYICKPNKEAFIRFEQGYKQQAFLEHVFEKFGLYSHMKEPSKRFINQNQLSSFWFKTFSHPSFTKIFLLFRQGNGTSNRKTITPNLLRDHVTARGLAYWIMCDGSLQRYNKSLILHTQGFNQEENKILSNELNEKFGLHSKVIDHKHNKTDTRKERNYFTIFIPTKDCTQLANLITPYMIPSMKYKIPVSVANE